MTSVGIEVLGNPRALAAKFGKLHSAEANRVWAAAADELITEELKAEAPFRPGPGPHLRDSIAGHILVAGEENVNIEFTADVPWAGYVIHGTRPHLIRAHPGKTLHWSEGGAEHFAKVVHHPGTRPNDFPQRVADRVLPYLINSYHTAMEAAL